MKATTNRQDIKQREGNRLKKEGALGPVSKAG